MRWQFLGMFRAELLDLREILGFLRMGSTRGSLLQLT